MIPLVVSAAAAIFDAYKEYKQNQSIQSLEDFRKAEAEANKAIFEASKLYSEHLYVKGKFDDIESQRRALTDLLTMLSEGNADASAFQVLGIGAVTVLYCVEDAMSAVSFHSGDLPGVEDLVVTLVAKGTQIYALLDVAVIQATAGNDVNWLTGISVAGCQKVVTTADEGMKVLRRKSDARFRYETRKVLAPDFPGGLGYLYGYWFEGTWHSEQHDPSPPGRNNTLEISRAKASMLAHQDKVFPKFRGVAETGKIIRPLLPRFRRVQRPLDATQSSIRRGTSQTDG